MPRRGPLRCRCRQAIRGHPPEPVRPAVVDKLSDQAETASVSVQTGASGPAFASWIAITSSEPPEKTNA